MKKRTVALLTAILSLACGQNSTNPGPTVDTGRVAGARTAVASKSIQRQALMDAVGTLDTPATPATDQRRVPHYFGPFPNWANSPFTFPDVKVTIVGDGSGATATAEVGAGGAVTAINVTDPGVGYTVATVSITPESATGTGTGATAKARIDNTSFVKAINLGYTGTLYGAQVSGTGYSAPSVVLSGGNPKVPATAVAYGVVEDNIVLPNNNAPLSGYSNPTVDFDMPEGPDGVKAVGQLVFADPTTNSIISGVRIVSGGSGYTKAPNVVIRSGTVMDPIRTGPAAVSLKSTIAINSIVLTNPGSKFNRPPTVTITDSPPAGTAPGTGATATAVLQQAGIIGITLINGGSNYVTQGGIKKFVDGLPGLGKTAANNLGQYIPVALADQTTFLGADYYEIALVDYYEKMHTALPATRLRGYVQLARGCPAGSVALKDRNGVQLQLPNGLGAACSFDPPHYLGPTIVAQKDRAVRITFFNLLPTGTGGDFFLPVDSTMMGSGKGPLAMAMADPMGPGTVLDAARNPECTGRTYNMTTMAWETSPKPSSCFKDNRATLHLHGGNTPWISDGTPHQWITPAGETTDYPQGVSVRSVPDMVGAGKPANVPDCSANNDGCMTFYYTNQQSARLMFYHDHAWGITRLNVYAGEAAGYIIQDDAEKALVAKSLIPGPADTIPLIIQDRTFVPDTTTGGQLDQQDPTWDVARWGGKGSLWYHHVYMPAQNPGDPSGMSAFGRWMYGPWFWPPAGDIRYAPIDNPYYDVNCKLDDPATWQYLTDPFCEPKLIPGTPNISAGMEQFNDTPVVNGTVYPTTNLAPKTYRFRILNAANDRFWNLHWYVADATGTEVALKAAEVAAAQLDPNVFPTPDTTLSPPGPSWIQIGSEGGFLPAPTVIPPQPITWITDPTRFDVGNVDQHSLLLAPAERADVIVDFSAYAGKTLILYNDAPAAFPARVASYDYYTGAPDLTPVGAPKILPGYGPNTRTIMQVKISANGATAAFNLNALRTAFLHKADGSGVFEASQHPIIVGQATYNSAYGTAFTGGGWCTPTGPNIPCDGFARIAQQGGEPFIFDTLSVDPVTGGTLKLSIPFQPKALHDEMNSTSFDEYGRMQAILGVESVPATPGLQNVNLYPYAAPITEMIDTTNLPNLKALNAAGLTVTPIESALDGTQIWKITHNGVDTHPIHFHAFDVQVLNRVTWDNIVLPPDPNELGWKETVRISPLEDTIVALRPVIPDLPWDLPNSVRTLNPMMPADVQLATTVAGNPLLPVFTAINGVGINVYNELINFGAEYVYHCHILSHEEMDMMRPVALAYPPMKPTGLTFSAGSFAWTDNSLSETAFVVQKDVAGVWTEVVRLDRNLADVNGTGPASVLALVAPVAGEVYRVVAENKVGDYKTNARNNLLTPAASFPVLTLTTASDPYTVPLPVP